MTEQAQTFVEQLKTAVRGNADSPAGELPAAYVDAVVPWLLTCFVNDPEGSGWRELEIAAGIASEGCGATSDDLEVACDRLQLHLAVVALAQHRSEWVGLMGLGTNVGLKVDSPAE